MNNKGFTLIELLAVLVILTAIMSIAIPAISSSMERTKAKQDKTKHKIFEAAAESYVTDHKNKVYKNLINGKCYFALSDLSEYLSEETMKDSNDNPFDGYVIFTSPNTFKYQEELEGKYCLDSE